MINRGNQTSAEYAAAGSFWKLSSILKRVGIGSRDTRMLFLGSRRKTEAIRPTSFFF